MNTLKLKSLNFAPSEITSASSLLNVDGRIFVCCDDQHSLYELRGQSWFQHKWSEAPVLPKNLKELKKVKPDFEALLGPIRDGAAMLLIPSGSKSNRTQVLKFDLQSHEFTAFDMLPFFQLLNHKLGSLNVEGTAIDGDDYIFMNRGALAEQSSLVRVEVSTLLIKSICKLDFGFLKDIPLHGSELCLFENKIYALAVAEDTSNSYDDGKVVGSALFEILLSDFSIQNAWQFELAVKLEGLCRYQNQWLVSTDPDGLGPSEFFSFDL